MSIFKDLIDNKGRTSAERAEAKELERLINEEAKANFYDPEWRREFAAVLTESIQEGFEVESMFPEIVNVESVGFDDRIILEEETGLEVFYTAKGGHIEQSSLVSEKLEMPRDTLGFHVSEFEDKLLAGFAHQVGQLRNMAVKRLDFGIQKEVKNLVEAAAPPAGSYHVSGAGINQAALNTAIREVRDESDGASVTIFGRSTVVDQISDFPGFADEALEEVRQRGRLGVYHGATIIALNQYKDEWGNSFMPANELYVIAGDAGRFVLYGGLKAKEYVEDDNWYWHYLGRQDFGGIVHHPERLRRFEDTNIAA